MILFSSFLRQFHCPSNFKGTQKYCLLIRIKTWACSYLIDINHKKSRNNMLDFHSRLRWKGNCSCFLWGGYLNFLHKLVGAESTSSQLDLEHIHKHSLLFKMFRSLWKWLVKRLWDFKSCQLKMILIVLLTSFETTEPSYWLM